MLQYVWHVGLAAPQPVEYFQTRDRTRVPCIGRLILHHGTTRKSCFCSFKCPNSYMTSRKGWWAADMTIPNMGPHCLPAQMDSPHWLCLPTSVSMLFFLHGVTVAEVRVCIKPLSLLPELQQKMPTLPWLLSPQSPDPSSLWEGRVHPTAWWCLRESSNGFLARGLWTFVSDLMWAGVQGQGGQGNSPFGEKEEGEEASGWVLLGVTCLRCVDLTCWPVPGPTFYKYGGGVLSHVWLFVSPWTVAHQAPLPLGLSRQEYWSGSSFPPPGDLPDSGIEPESPTVARGFITTWATWEALTYMVLFNCITIIL